MAILRSGRYRRLQQRLGRVIAPEAEAGCGDGDPDAERWIRLFTNAADIEEDIATPCARGQPCLTQPHKTWLWISPDSCTQQSDD